MKKIHHMIRMSLLLVIMSSLQPVMAQTTGKAIADDLHPAALRPDGYPRQDATQAKATGNALRTSFTQDELPDNYAPLGATGMVYRNEDGIFDFIGRFNNSWYGTTHGEYGFKTAFHSDAMEDAVWLDDALVIEQYLKEAEADGNDEWAQELARQLGGLRVRTEVKPDGDYAKVTYRVTNVDKRAHTFSLGSRADVELGDNDGAPLKMLRNGSDVIGVEMANSIIPEEAASMQVLFAARSNVTDVDSYWFGNYLLNDSPFKTVGHYVSPSYAEHDFTRTFIAKSKDGDEVWKYTLTEPAAGWNTPGFNDKGWQSAVAGFGSKGRTGVKTEWNGEPIWLRRTFDLDITQDQLELLRFSILHNVAGYCEVYLNGVSAFFDSDYYSEYIDYDINPAALKALNLHGTNTIAVRAHNDWGGQQLDVAIGLQEGLYRGASNGRNLYPLLHTGQQGGDIWRYTNEQPADSWKNASFDDSKWKSGRSAFGNRGWNGTAWESEHLWLRTDLNLRGAGVTKQNVGDLKLLIHHDDGCQVFFNGVLAYDGQPWLDELQEKDILPEALAALDLNGHNTIAVYCHQDWGEQQFDMGLGWMRETICPHNNLYVEYGSYDSGMGWCWTDRTIAPGETKELSMLFCVGNVPDSSYDPNTGPDISITSFTLDRAAVEAGDSLTAVIAMANTGNEPMEAGMLLELWSSELGGQIWSYNTRQAIPVGKTLRITPTIKLPNRVCDAQVYANVNPDRSLKETNYDNNTAGPLPLSLRARYSTNVVTDASIYMQGSPITFSGKAEGANVGLKNLDLIIENTSVWGRETHQVTTDKDGSWRFIWNSYPGWTGHFRVWCLYPGTPTDGIAPQAEFDIRGLQKSWMLTNGEWQGEQLILTIGQTDTLSVVLSNPGTLPLTDIRVSASAAPHLGITLDAPTRLDGGAEGKLTALITAKEPSTGDQYEQLTFTITTAEGITATQDVWYYCKHPSAKLITDIGVLNATMVAGASTDYSFQLINVGAAPTGQITMSLPEVGWMTAVTPFNMPSLAPGDSATVVLRLTPTDDMQLNVPQTGRIAFNTASGIGAMLDYTVEPVSNALGEMIVDVCDEYTYYTDEAPHVSGATVNICHPVTGVVLATDTTGVDGKARFTLPAGWYTLNVTAEKHTSYSNNHQVMPSRATNVTVDLSVKTISISFEVEEINDLDEYRIVTTMEFETYVPVPTVEMLVDEQPLEAMKPGESLIYNTVLVNHGLIRANDTNLQFEDDEWFSFEPLMPLPIDLDAQCSYIVPVKVTRLDGSSDAPIVRNGKSIPVTGGDMGCSRSQTVEYSWKCGNHISTGSYDAIVWQAGCGSGGGSIGGGFFIGGGGSGSGYAGEGGGMATSVTYTDCDPCINELMKNIVECLLSFIPGVGNALGLTSCLKSIGTGDMSTSDVINCLASVGGTVLPVICPPCAPAGKLINAAMCVYNIANTSYIDNVSGPEDEKIMCFRSNGSGGGNGGGGNGGGGNGGGNGGGGNDNPGGKFANDMRREGETEEQVDSLSFPKWFVEFQEKAGITYQWVDAYINVIREFIGDDEHFNDYDKDELSRFIDRHTSMTAPYEAIDYEGYIPDVMSNEAFERFVSRMNGTYPEDPLDRELIDSLYNVINDCTEKAKRFGYLSVLEMWDTERNLMVYRYEHPNSSVCAKIKIEIEQTLTLTRQAFMGTLTVYNGHESIPMTDFHLDLVITDPDGNVSTPHEFQVNMESNDGFAGGLTGDSLWTLAAGATGKAKIKFIPTRYAAPEKPVVWKIGGSVTYVDPFTGFTVRRELQPVPVTVKPSPVLELIYFQERDVMGDDPFTEEIEPSEDVEFAMLMLNKGAGDATNVNMVTKQPRIVENEKGLFINYEMISSALNGGEKTLALGESVATEFGTVPAHSSAYAQWWMRSSLIGHFIDYDIKVTHVTSYDNKDLSLVDTVHVHELIRSIEVPATDREGNTVAWLVNDASDGYSRPDVVYFTDGTTAPVWYSREPSLSGGDEGEDGCKTFTLTVPEGVYDWQYGIVDDPSEGHGKIRSVTRVSDGAKLPVRNFWITKYTFFDGMEPVKENKLHFADEAGTAGNSYRITFEPMPDTWLAVESIYDVPASDIWVTTPVRRLNVRFNKPIDDSTFTYEDLSLHREAVWQDLSGVTIMPFTNEEGTTDYALDLSSVTDSTGYYVLYVQTSGITDNEGFQGESGKSVNWMQILEGSGINPTADDDSDEDGPIYDIWGRPLSDDYKLEKGIYIVGHKKVIVK